MGSTTAETIRYGPCVTRGSHSFYLPPTHEPYLPLLPSRRASPPFGSYSLRLPTKGWPGWVDLGGWSHTEINVPHQKLNPDTVIHLCTNRARRWLTSLNEANALTTTPDHHLPLRQADISATGVPHCQYSVQICVFVTHSLIIIITITHWPTQF